MEKQPKNKTPADTRIPVSVLTGFLGSGKTTLLNYILNEKHGLRIAVIENEFGEVGVDDELVDRKIFGNEEIIEMKNGCICCTVRSDLIKILKDLITLKKDKFDYVVIETTGLADPAPVAQTFFMDPEIAKSYYLDAIITLVDAKHFEQHLDEEKGEGVENEAREQIAFADKILLNKIDLVEKDYIEHLKKRIKEVNDSVEIFETQNSIIDLAKILGIKAFDLANVLKNEPEFLTDTEHQHDKSVTSVGLVFEGKINKFKFDCLLNKIILTQGNDLFRYKGVVDMKGDDRKYVFQGIHMLFMDTPLKVWEKGEKRVNKMCFIGRKLDRVALTEGVYDCIEKDDLRFLVGDKVQARTGKDSYENATIIAHWDECNAYRIKLASGTEVWAPVDDDVFVKKRDS